MILDLYPRPPFDFARTAACSRLYATMQVYRDGALYRLFRVGDGLALVRVTDVGGDPSLLHLRAECVATQGEVDEERLAEEVRYWMALDRSFADFYDVLDSDRALRLIVYSLHGLHMLRTPSVFEALMVTMIEQQIALSAAQKAERWLVETYGDHLEYEGVRYSAFPKPDTIAALDEIALTPLKITFVRMRRMLAIARAVAIGSLDVEALRHKSKDEAYVALMALNGVGHWTAAWTMIRALGTYLYVGSADVALRAAVNQYWYGQPERANREQTDAHFAQYGDYAGEACVLTLMLLGVERYPNIAEEGVLYYGYEHLKHFYVWQFGRRDFFHAMKRADSSLLEPVLRYVEDDTHSFGSGYKKEVIWKYIKRFELDSKQLARLEQAALGLLGKPMRPHFKHMCQTMSRIATPRFWKAVEKQLHSDNPRIQVNATCLFPYSEGIYEGEKQRMELKQIKSRLRFRNYYRGR